MEPETPLRRARRNRNLSMQEMADELGVSLGQMSRIERFGTTDARHALKLSTKLGVKLEVVISPEGGA